MNQIIVAPLHKSPSRHNGREPAWDFFLAVSADGERFALARGRVARSGHKTVKKVEYIDEDRPPPDHWAFDEQFAADWGAVRQEALPPGYPTYTKETACERLASWEGLLYSGHGDEVPGLEEARRILGDDGTIQFLPF